MILQHGFLILSYYLCAAIGRGRNEQWNSDEVILDGQPSNGGPALEADEDFIPEQQNLSAVQDSQHHMEQQSEAFGSAR